MATITTALSTYASTTPILLAFAAGLITALFISRRDALTRWTRLSARAAGRALVEMWGGGSDDITRDTTDDERSRPLNGSVSDTETEDMGKREDVTAERETEVEKKPFDFRHRQWHEPPEEDDLPYFMGYEDKFGDDDAVQKEFKAMGGKDLEWRTASLDLFEEGSLLHYYKKFAKLERSFHDPEDPDNAFYKSLYKDLKYEIKCLEKEMDLLHRKHGKTQADEDNFVNLMSSILRREQDGRNHLL